jgi:putative ABC transport system permease protein
VYRDIKVAFRSLWMAKGLSITVILTLALGIGANAAIFSVVRGVLLRPLSNRDESHLIYIRQSAKGIGSNNLTFSVPEIQDLRARSRSFTQIAEFSTMSFTMIGLGDPRVIQAGVVNGNYFDVVGLRPVTGRLLTVSDDGPAAEPAAVLTYRFWTAGLKGDPAILGKKIRLGSGALGERIATIVGVLEPSDPYPAQTELITNVAASPHHLGATMATNREHRMTEVFARLAPGTTLESARTELRNIYASMRQENAAAYSGNADFQIGAWPLRDEITSNARTILLVLLTASGLIFVIACSNVANLILARAVRREGELAVRAALGARRADLRRSLLAESLVLCSVGAGLGVVISPVMFSAVSRYAARFSVRALDLTLDSTGLWIGAALALASAVLLAFVPKLPSADAANGFGLAGSGLRITRSTRRRLRAFAVVQIAASFVLLAGAAMLLRTLLNLQAARPGFQTANVLAIDVPLVSFNRKPEDIRRFYRELRDQVSALPGVEGAALSNAVPWRDTGGTLAFSITGKENASPRDDPRAFRRTVSPGFFGTLGIPLLAGRDFNDGDRNGAERVVIVNARIASQLFPGQDPLNRSLRWTDPITQFVGISMEPRRIVGVVADVDDTAGTVGKGMSVYAPVDQDLGSRLLLRTQGNPYALVPSVARIAHDLFPDQPVERAATLEDVRSEVLAPDRLNTIVFGGFAVVALAISVVGIAGVLAFSVGARTRELGVRLALGSQPRRLLAGILIEGTVIALFGIASGLISGYGAARIIGSYILPVALPGIVPLAAAAVLLVAAAAIASLAPAIRASRVDIINALRSE